MKGIVFNTIFILGAINLIMLLFFIIVFLILKLYEKIINFKYKDTAVAIEFLARKGVDCNKLCKTIDFIRGKND